MISSFDNLAGAPIDSSNQFDVVRRDDGSVAAFGLWRRMGADHFVTAGLTRAEALNLAAWLSVLADPEGKDFGRLVEEIKKG